MTTTLAQLDRALARAGLLLRPEPSYDIPPRPVSPRHALALAVIQARLQRRWTQSDLARRAKTKQSRVSQIENRRGNVRLETLERILGALNLTIAFPALDALEASHAPRNGKHTSGPSNTSSNGKTPRRAATKGR